MITRFILSKNAMDGLEEERLTSSNVTIIFPDGTSLTVPRDWCMVRYKSLKPDPEAAILEASLPIAAPQISRAPAVPRQLPDFGAARKCKPTHKPIPVPLLCGHLEDLPDATEVKLPRVPICGWSEAQMRDVLHDILAMYKGKEQPVPPQPERPTSENMLSFWEDTPWDKEARFIDEHFCQKDPFDPSDIANLLGFSHYFGYYTLVQVTACFFAHLLIKRPGDEHGSERMCRGVGLASRFPQVRQEIKQRLEADYGPAHLASRLVPPSTAPRKLRRVTDGVAVDADHH
jgi:hypothetical protein